MSPMVMDTDLRFARQALQKEHGRTLMFEWQDGKSPPDTTMELSPHQVIGAY